MMALAAEPPVAMETARTALRDLDRTSDVVCHPEMVLAVAIAYARSGDRVRASDLSRCRATVRDVLLRSLRPPPRLCPRGSVRTRCHRVSRRPRLRRPASTSSRYSTASSAHNACQNPVLRHFEARGHQLPVALSLIAVLNPMLAFPSSRPRARISAGYPRIRKADST